MSNRSVDHGGLTAPTPSCPFPSGFKGGSRKGSAVLVAFTLGLLFYTGLAAAGRLDDAQKRSNEFFKDKTFSAKVDLKTSGKHDVDPDGHPTEGKSQGRRRGRRGIGQRDVAFAAGNGGRGIYIRVDESDKEIKVILQAKRGPTMHSSSIYIHFDRPLTEADVDPRAIARAVAPYVEFEGVIVGEEITDALDKLTAAEETSAPAAQAVAAPSAGPSVVALTVSAVPTVLRRGEDVVLRLVFEISLPGTGDVEVAEHRTLTTGGVSLPGYPVTSFQSRGAAEHASNYRQPIPPSAATGTYEYRGEVCIGGDCISRTVTFEIEP